ncbi:hypothetical protein CW311_05205 [Acinetobacter proteolyticus]|uniref:Uncharacterized protein n=1 Tax=Acinetobacter proteolyticus TaxID=1776741 RepID=A0A2N0WHY0_9GAMM|nr:hypothetical protein CW311_05205 [Acinetobacter proteolyticus]
MGVSTYLYCSISHCKEDTLKQRTRDNKACAVQTQANKKGHLLIALLIIDLVFIAFQTLVFQSSL